MQEIVETVTFGTEKHIPELGIAVMVEKSIKGTQTHIHIRRVRRIQSRDLTRHDKKR